jgi:hypothetical protein
MTATKNKPVEEVKPVENTPVAVDHLPAIKKLVGPHHRNAARIDIKPLWDDKAWRINVYEADDGPVVRKLTLAYSYFVKLDKDDTLFFQPKLGTKS